MDYSLKTIPFAPTFQPSQQEFQGFKDYVYKLSELKEVREAGCVKVISSDYSTKEFQIQFY